MKKLIGSLFLCILATSLSAFLMPIGIIVAFWFMIFKHDVKIAIKYMDRLLFNFAVSLDVLGNFVCAILFNLTLIKKNESAYRFGKQGETISSVLGKNQAADNLTNAGKILAKILNLIDNNHLSKSINNSI